MGMIFKFDMLKALKDKGYTTYKIREKKILSESTVQKLRKGTPVSWENIEALCRLLKCQPGDFFFLVGKIKIGASSPKNFARK